MSIENTPFVSNQEVSRTTLNTLVQRAVERLPGSAGISRWLRTKQLQAALRQVYHGFAAQYPDWVAGLFDQHFLLYSAGPVVEQYRQQGTLPTPIELATAWDRQLGPASEAVRQRRMAELTPVAADLLASVASAL